MQGLKSAKIVGCGLIGTSIALRLKHLGVEISVSDNNEKNLRLAQDLIGSQVTDAPELVIVATPPESILQTLKDEFEQNPEAILIEVSGVKSNLLLEVEEFPALSKNFCAVHPMAGREVTGPQSARADLFEGRAWIISKTQSSSQKSIELAKKVGELLGSTTYSISPAHHDSAIAAVSHLPQILSSLLAGSLTKEPIAALDLAGQGLRDVTRLADSDASLWASLLIANAAELEPRINSLIQGLQNLNANLQQKSISGVKNFISQGNDGRELIPGKHGAKKRYYTFLPIVINDKPGQLAAIFEECANIQVNIEDLELEHSPGQEMGLITLALSQSDATKLKAHLESQGWLAHEPRSS